jgi:subtilisin-like proprotein convertase family protein
MIALMLSARYNNFLSFLGATSRLTLSRPQLGWRDIQQLIVETGQMTDPTDPDWAVNGAGRHVSHKYGFGRLDADLLVTRAMNHTLLPSPALSLSKASNPNKRIPTSVTSTEGVKGLIDTITITSEDLGGMGLASLEHVQATIRIKHPERRHLTIVLTSPSGTLSTLAVPRFKDDSSEGFNPWTFMTVRTWGESPIGTWTLHVMDGRSGDRDPYTGEAFQTGELLEWTLHLHGTCAKEDILPDPISGIGKCSHSIVRAEKKARARILVYFVAGGVVLMMLAAMMVWRRVAFRRWMRQGRWPGSGGGRVRIKKAKYSPFFVASPNGDVYGTDGDIESPTRFDAESPILEFPDDASRDRPVLLPVLLRGLEPFNSRAVNGMIKAWSRDYSAKSPTSPGQYATSPIDLLTPMTDDGDPNFETEDENSPIRPKQPSHGHVRQSTSSSVRTASAVSNTATAQSKPSITLKAPPTKVDIQGLRSRSSSTSSLNRSNSTSRLPNLQVFGGGAANPTFPSITSHDDLRQGNRGSVIGRSNNSMMEGASRNLLPTVLSLLGGGGSLNGNNSSGSRRSRTVSTSTFKKGNSAADIRKND